jgi:hypothetical protein
MEKITSHQVVGLMEAYAAVHAPQINENQVWEEVETWVNSLVEEGYDLSEYSWEDMYEEYITEIGVNLGGQGAVNAVKSRSAQQQQSAAKLDAARAQRFGAGAYRTTGPAPATAKPSRGGSSDPYGASGAVKSRSASLPASARQVTQYPQGVSTGVGGGNAGASRQAPVARPAPAAARPATAAPARPAARPATAAPAATKPAPAAATTGNPPLKPPALPPVPGRESLASQAAELRAMQAASRQRQGLTQSFDVFDVIKGHLIDEGYADTEEAALKIMANMSEDWKQSIVENRGMSHSGGKPGASGDGSKPKGITGGKDIQMPGWNDKGDTKKVKDA